MPSKKTRITITVFSLIIATISLTIAILINQKEEPLPPIDNTTYADKITIETFINEYNKELKENNHKYLLDEKYLKIENNIYYYGIYDDIVLYLVPEEYTGNKEKDILKTTAIFYPINTENEKIAKNYIDLIFKKNYKNITNTEIDTLIIEAKESSKNNLAVNKNDGLFISYNEKENNKVYIITRNYKK